MTYKVTGLKLQKRNRQRVNIFLDGEFAFGLSRIVAAWLQVGQELSEEKIAELKNQDAEEVAYQQALKLLNTRLRSKAEIRRNLEEHKFSSEAIEAAFERLERSRLVDDQRFAMNWVENRTEFRPRSIRALTVEMRQRGIPEETIAQAIENLDDEDLAHQAGIKQSRKLTNLEWQDFRQKLGGYLQRKGFSYHVIAPTVRKIWDEIQSEKLS